MFTCYPKKSIIKNWSDLYTKAHPRVFRKNISNASLFPLSAVFERPDGGEYAFLLNLWSRYTGSRL